MAELWPSLGDIRLSFDLLSRSNYQAWSLSDAGFRALMAFVSQCAAGLVWTYSPPGDGSLPDDDEVLARIAGINKRKWLKIRPEVEVFFRIRRGRWHLKADWIAVDDRPVRFAIPSAVQAIVLTREGRVCIYCGDTAGPFDFDHILPVVKGGSNGPSNLTLACASCNRSKGAKTLREWRG